jgi:hypothetical protein
VNDYEIVSDSYRDDEDAGLTEALLSGKTVFIPDASQGSINTLYARYLNRYQRKLRRRTSEVKGKRGFVVWLDEASGE